MLDEVFEVFRWVNIQSWRAITSLCSLNGVHVPTPGFPQTNWPRGHRHVEYWKGGGRDVTGIET